MLTENSSVPYATWLPALQLDELLHCIDPLSPTLRSQCGMVLNAPERGSGRVFQLCPDCLRREGLLAYTVQPGEEAITTRDVVVSMLDAIGHDSLSTVDDESAEVSSYYFHTTDEACSEAASRAISRLSESVYMHVLRPIAGITAALRGSRGPRAAAAASELERCLVVMDDFLARGLDAAATALRTGVSDDAVARVLSTTSVYGECREVPMHPPFALDRGRYRRVSATNRGFTLGGPADPAAVHPVRRGEWWPSADATVLHSLDVIQTQVYQLHAACGALLVREPLPTDETTDVTFCADCLRRGGWLSLELPGRTPAGINDLVRSLLLGLGSSIAVHDEDDVLDCVPAAQRVIDTTDAAREAGARLSQLHDGLHDPFRHTLEPMFLALRNNHTPHARQARLLLQLVLAAYDHIVIYGLDAASHLLTNAPDPDFPEPP